MYFEDSIIPHRLRNKGRLYSIRITLLLNMCLFKDKIHYVAKHVSWDNTSSMAIMCGYGHTSSNFFFVTYIQYAMIHLLLIAILPILEMICCSEQYSHSPSSWLSSTIHNSYCLFACPIFVLGCCNKACSWRVYFPDFAWIKLCWELLSKTEGEK